MNTTNFQQALNVITYFRELFSHWSEQKVLLAFLDFLFYVNANVTEASQVCSSTVVNLKSDIASQLYNVSKTDKIEEVVHVMNRMAAVYQRMDLNHHIMWEKLLTFIASVKNNEEVRIIWFVIFFVVAKATLPHRNFLTLRKSTADTESKSVK